MKSKKRKNKNRRKKKRIKPLKSSLPNQNKMKDPAFTTTGELFQPVRIHYNISDASKLNSIFSNLECLDYDHDRKRWVWLLIGETLNLNFKYKPNEENPIILGEFFFENSKNLILNLRSHERALNAVVFFDNNIPKTVIDVTDITTINRLFSLKEVASTETLNQLFETNSLKIRDPEKITQDLLELKDSIDDETEQRKAINKYMLELSNEKTPEIEKFPSNYYEDGIESLQFSLRVNQIVAIQHWKGNTDFTAMDAIREGLKK